MRVRASWPSLNVISDQTMVRAGGMRPSVRDSNLCRIHGLRSCQLSILPVVGRQQLGRLLVGVPDEPEGIEVLIPRS
jgi:hypothetical protein